MVGHRRHSYKYVATQVKFFIEQGQFLLIVSNIRMSIVEFGQAKGLTSTPNRGLAIVDFMVRLLAVAGTLGGAIVMASTEETLPFSTQFVRFRAEYDDLPTFTYVHASFLS